MVCRVEIPNKKIPNSREVDENAAALKLKRKNLGTQS
jgi:hypothetical protein